MFFYILMAHIETYSQEGIAISWPQEYKWKIISSQESNKINSIELIPSSEKEQNWTLLGKMVSLKGVKNISLDKAMKKMYEQTKEDIICTKLTFLEKNDYDKYPWILFKIESSCSQKESENESQLWFIRQGNQSLYINFISVKKKTLENKFIKLWTRIFKDSEIVFVEKE